MLLAGGEAGDFTSSFTIGRGARWSSYLLAMCLWSSSKKSSLSDVPEKWEKLV